MNSGLLRLGRYSRNRSGLWCDNPDMLNAAITCAKSSPSTGRPCDPLYLDTHEPAELPAAIAKALAEHGWSERDGEHFCPVHNPAELGDVVEIEPVRYRPLGDSGWEARIPGNAHAQGMAVSVEIRRQADAPKHSEPVSEPEPVSDTDEAAEAITAFLDALDAHLGEYSRATRYAGYIATPEWADVALRAPDLRSLLDERAAQRALAPDAREHEDPFYRPGGVYVSVNGWWRFTCKAVVAGVALGVEECLKDRQEPRFTKRNIWRSVRAAGCDYEVDCETGEPIDARSDDDD